MISSTYASAQVPLFNSHPSAPAVLLLDFDGHTVTGTSWNTNGPIVCEGANLSTEALTEIYNRIAEDYRPFNINVTTDETKYAAAPATRRMRALFTITSNWYGNNAGGCAMTGSFTWGDNTPCFIFTALLQSNVKNISEVGAHEPGHTLGLTHQAEYDANCNKLNSYNYGTGTGEIGWAPIMGVGYNRNTTTWFNGPTPTGCNNLQSDANIISGITNGFGYRPDDAGESFQSASEQTFSSRKFVTEGLINNPADKDLFKLTLDIRQQVKLTAIPTNVGANNTGANLDIQIQIFNSAQTLVNTYNPPLTLSASMDTILDAGTYYFSVDGVANEFTPDYGSLGAYTVSVEKSLEDAVTVAPPSPTITTPTFSMELQGQKAGSSHKLSWTINSSGNVLNQLLEISSDGVNFINLASPAVTDRSFSYHTSSTNAYYRLTVNVSDNKEQYSNIVNIKKTTGGGGGKKPQLNSTLISNNELVLNSPATYNYIISDYNGRTMYRGIVSEGSKSITLNKLTNGVYIIHFTNGSEHYVEKFVKQ